MVGQGSQQGPHQLIRVIFEEYEIPYFIDRKKDIINHPLVRMILSMLVGSVERSKSHEIKALYILGANDGVFPQAGMEEGIFIIEGTGDERFLQ